MTEILDALQRELVWRKARLARLGGNEWRIDDLGNLIRRQDYGNRNSSYGWEIDHHPVPKAMGGSNDLANLRPLHHKANSSHGGLLGAFAKRGLLSDAEPWRRTLLGEFIASQK